MQATLLQFLTLIFCQILNAQENSFIHSLFLGIPISEETAVLNNAVPDLELQQEDCWLSAKCWRTQKHPFLQDKPLEILLVLERNVPDDQDMPKVWLEIINPDNDHKHLQKALKKLRLVMDRHFGKGEKSRFFSTLFSRDTYAYYPQHINGYIKLKWEKSNCKGSYSILLEYFQ